MASFDIHECKGYWQRWQIMTQTDYQASTPMADSPFIKTIVIVIFVMILISLGTAFLSLFRKREEDETRTVKALTVRVGLSIALVAMLAILHALGLITPNG